MGNIDPWTTVTDLTDLTDFEGSHHSISYTWIISDLIPYYMFLSRVLTQLWHIYTSVEEFFFWNGICSKHCLRYVSNKLFWKTSFTSTVVYRSTWLPVLLTTVSTSDSDACCRKAAFTSWIRGLLRPASPESSTKSRSGTVLTRWRFFAFPTTSSSLSLFNWTSATRNRFLPRTTKNTIGCWQKCSSNAPNSTTTR